MISILLAAYNIDLFVTEALDSILSQTFKNFELICFDDGSTDNTLEILKKYETRDSRIQVIAKKSNEGLAVARNESLKLARGKYVLFLDADDLFDETLLEKAFDVIEKEQSDIIYWDYVTFYKTNEIEKLKIKKSDLLNIDVCDKQMWLRRPSFTCVKMIRTEKARELKIHFPKGLTRQDIPVHWNLVTQLDKVSVLPERLIYYRQQPNATTAKKDKRLFDLAYVMDITKEFLIEKILYAQYKDEFLRQRLNLLSGMYDSITKNLKNEALTLITERLGHDETKYINSNSDLRVNSRLFFKAYQGSVIHKVLYISRLYIRLVYRFIKD